MSVGSGETGSLPGRLVAMVESLRGHGMVVGTSETVDAARVMEVLSLADRALLREGLAAALLRRSGQRRVFDAVFDVYFPVGVGGRESVREETQTRATGAGEDRSSEPPTVAELREDLVDALARGSGGALDEVAAAAVDALGAVQGADGPGMAGSGWSARQTLEQLRPQTAIVRALARRGSTEGFAERLDRDEVRRDVERFRELVQSEASRRTAEVRGRERVARYAVRPDASQVEFLAANRAQVLELRRAVQPLARRLATRLSARRRRRNRGQVDIRRTLRRSMSYGGVPLQPVFEHRRKARPELVLLCDVSGSVAGFAGFTMLLVQALRDQFSKVRVFAFVNHTDEVTELVTSGESDPAALAERISSSANVAPWHPSSDYGRALRSFVSRYGNVVGPRTSVLILGDARTNNLDPDLDALRDVVARARRTFWLNPEHESRWGLGDSVAPAYAQIVDMHECRTVDQLSRLVGRLLPV
ncbi:VWA domain-containing protein [Mumia sp.]|uniref:vWA domain-containing protein n=1 Tax=Mumia sp. TaxID=1965300 RepID=UPI002603E9B9|nr:VWA domain-containing protein [Mumia sp.]MDD9347950.1 VWA domain-containing protein [Mumia sp.]